jgi:uncharacterized repeat protein (TIGR01451 family)
VDTRKTVLLGIRRGIFVAVLIGFALWPELTRGRTSIARAPESAQVAGIRNFQRATEQPPWSADLNAVAVHEDGVLFVAAGGACGATSGAGVFRSSNAGESWSEQNNGLTSKSVKSLVIGDSGAIFAGTHDGVFRSTDFGTTWTPTMLLGVDISTMASGPDVLFAADGCGCSGAFRSTDEGESWQPVEGLAGCVRGMTVDPLGAVFAVTASNGVYRSTDNGTTWAPANAGLTTLDLKTVAVDAESHVFVGSASDGVFRSTDGGATWARVGLSGLRVNTLAIRAGSAIFAGTDSGVYQSTDDGYTWDAVDLGLSAPAHVRALALGKHGMAFAAAGRNVLRGTSPPRAGFGEPVTSALQVTSPTIDSVASTSGTLVTTLGWDHTVVGTPDILIVGTSNSGNKTVLSVTYGSTLLTRQGFLSNGGKDRVEIWALLPNPPGVTSGHVTVTLSGAADLVAGSIAFSGVDPTTPLGTFASAQANTNNPFLSLSTNTGAVVVDTLAATGDALSVIAGGGQTTPPGGGWSISTGATGTNVRGAASTKTATGTSTAMSWTLGAAKSWALGAIPVNPVGVIPPCVIGYPTTETGFPRSSVIFAENVILRGDQGPAQCTGTNPSAIVAFYNDEHAITLGVRRVIVNTAGNRTCSGGPTPGISCTGNAQCGKGGTCVGVGTDFPVSLLTTNPGHASTSPGFLPLTVGTTDASGVNAGVDTNTCVGDANCGRPMWPALYITDITDNPNDRSGDWQHNGTANNPSDIFGTWKAAVRTVDNTVSPPAVSVVPDADPVKNNWNLCPTAEVPCRADPVPPGLLNEGYGAEVRWNLDSSLVDNHGNGLVANRKYRLQVIVHDGDQNKGGGDVGEGCANATFAQECFTPPTPTPTPTGFIPTDTPTPTPTVAVGELAITKTADPVSVCNNTCVQPAIIQTSCSANTGTHPCSGPPTDITYPISVKNNGPDASTVVVSDTLPQFTHFKSCTIVTTTTPLTACTGTGLVVGGTGTVTIDAGDMLSGNGADITLMVTADGESMYNNGNNSVTLISNTATVSSSGPGTNSSTATISVSYPGTPFVRSRPNLK